MERLRRKREESLTERNWRGIERKMWTLIIVLTTTNGGVSITNVQFGSEQACKAAQYDMARHISFLNPRPAALQACFRTDTPAQTTETK